MLRLRSCILTHLLSSRTTCHGSPLRRLLSAAAPPVSPRTGFAVEEYLVDTCCLTRAQALKASTKLSHLRSPSKPDAVLAFLAGLGLSTAAVAAAVARDPQLLCAGVERTLSPIVVGLTGLGLSHSEIARLVSLSAGSFRCKSVVPKPREGGQAKCGVTAGVHARCLRYWQGVHHCTKDAHRQCRTNTGSGGVPRGTVMFRLILLSVGFLSEDKIAAKVDFLKKTFRWSDAEIGIVVSKDPIVLRRSKNTLQRRSEFLISELGLEPAYVAHRPAMLSYSLEGRLRPRYCVVKFLKENGLLEHRHSYYTALKQTEGIHGEVHMPSHGSCTTPC